MITRGAPLLAALLLWAPTTAWSQDLDQLEANLRGLAKNSIPKTVLIKAIVDQDRQGAGSGAIVSEDGYILTCSHVIEIGKRIEVYTADGTKYDAKVVGKNTRQDFALIKVDTGGVSLPTFTIADSDTVKKGDWVVALGHPGGPYKDLKPAFAAGKVRDLERKLPVGMMSKYYNHAIMTDVPIFAGDSGGPLINAKGELVGINGAIVMINEMAFAVPMNQIMAQYDRLKAGETIEGEKAGPEAFAEMQKLISPEDYQKMTQKMMKKFGGMFGEDSPLSKMFGGENGEMPDLSKLFGGENGEGLDLGKLFGGGGGNGEMPDFGKLFGGGENGEMPDFGKLFGGGENGEGFDMSKLFGEDSPFKKMFGGENGEMPDMSKLFGEDSPLKKMFGGQGGEGMPDLGKLFGGGQPEAPAPAPKAQGNKAFLGIRIAPTGDSIEGILIQEVVPSGPAAQGGLKKGDVILSVGSTKTPNMQGLRSAMSGKKPGNVVEITVKRTVFADTVLVERQETFNVTLGSR